MADKSQLTTGYLIIITDFLTGDATASADHYVGMGTDGTEAAAAQTDLIAPSNEARAATTESQPTTTSARWVGANITSLSNQTVKEYGLFQTAGTGTPPTGGQMVARANVTAGQAILTGDLVQITATITVSQT
jgi:hypothetical protein